LGRASFRQDRWPEAHRLFAQSLAHHRVLGYRQGIATCLAGWAGVTVAEGQLERAARLLGATEALFEATGLGLWAAFQSDYDRAVAAVRAQLDPADFAAAWAEGREMAAGDGERAVAYVLELES
jgi:hypothetical protein